MPEGGYGQPLDPEMLGPTTPAQVAPEEQAPQGIAPLQLWLQTIGAALLGAAGKGTEGLETLRKSRESQAKGDQRAIIGQAMQAMGNISRLEREGRLEEAEQAGLQWGAFTANVSPTLSVQFRQLADAIRTRRQKVGATEAALTGIQRAVAPGARGPVPLEELVPPQVRPEVEAAQAIPEGVESPAQLLAAVRKAITPIAATGKDALNAAGIRDEEAQFISEVSPRFGNVTPNRVAEMQLSGSPSEQTEALKVRAAALQAQRESLEKRRLVIPPPAGAVDRVVAARNILDAISSATEITNRRQDLTGLLQGTEVELERAMGTTRDRDAIRLISALRQLRDEELVLRAGLAQTASEARRAVGLFQARLPTPQQTHMVFRENLSWARRRAQTAVKTYSEAYGTTSLGPLLEAIAGQAAAEEAPPTRKPLVDVPGVTVGEAE